MLLMAYNPLRLKERIPQIQLGSLHTLTYISTLTVRAGRLKERIPHIQLGSLHTLTYISTLTMRAGRLKERIAQIQLGSLHTLTYISTLTVVKNETLDKTDDFNCPIVNFPYLYSNISVAHIYGVYVSQLIQYSTALVCVMISMIQGCFS